MFGVTWRNEHAVALSEGQPSVAATHADVTPSPRICLCPHAEQAPDVGQTFAQTSQPHAWKARIKSTPW